ncbi:MAG: DUF1800 domain-containing protein [Pseudomonadota bacterium]
MLRIRSNGEQFAVKQLVLSAVAVVALAACSEVASDAPTSSASSDDGSSGSTSTSSSGNLQTVAAPLVQEDASRFLVQASFGPTEREIDRVMRDGYSEWIRDQIRATPTLHLTKLNAIVAAGDEIERSSASDSFWENAVEGDDQLRQRMTFALSQILVVSDGPGSNLSDRPLAMAYYMDILTRNAFGNYRDLIEEVTYSPAMAVYLTYLRNQKANPNNGRVPDENYAREILQLFTIGLVELQPDGTIAPGAQETFENEDIVGLAKVFTGLSLKGGFRRDNPPDAYNSRLEVYPEHHSTDAKSFLGLTIPENTDAATSISMALDQIFAHPNVAPFVSRQLIQRFVTSNPTSAYVGRVSAAFEAGSFVMPDGEVVGEGRRGDLAATISAVLLDPEARQPAGVVADDFGKVREPVLRLTHWARAFDVVTADAGEERYLQNTSGPDRLSQHPFRSPSVFNFYRPGYVAPSTQTGAAGLNAPELQIVNESSAIGYVNTMSRFVRDDSPNRGNNVSGDAFSPNYLDELDLAEDPEALTNRLDLLLTYGRMSAETRSRIIGVLQEMPIRDDRVEEDRERRIHTAVLMAVTAPEYLVQQ